MHDIIAEKLSEGKTTLLSIRSCQSHKFSHDCHEPQTHNDVVRLGEDVMMCLEPNEIVKACVEYFTQLLDVQVCIDDNVKKFEIEWKIIYCTMWHNHWMLIFQMF